MGLISALFTGVSGLTGNAEALNVIGDNIANTNTVGFKSSKAVFSDIFSVVLNNGSTAFEVGRGSQLQSVLQNFDQGAFESTGNALDVAVDGNGFFIVNDGTGNFYTRAGEFRINDQGLVQTPTGEIVQGFQITNNVVGSSLANIDLTGAQSAPQASTTFTLGANLDAAASAGTTFTSPISMFNSVGTEVILSVTFTKQAGANAWVYAATPSTGAVTAAASGLISFDTNGALSNTSDITMTIDYSSAAVPANAQTLVWNLVDAAGATNGNMTGFAAASNNNSVVQDGFGTGVLTGLAVDPNGKISGLFNNGQTDELYQLAMADFLSPTGLTRVGQNLFAVSAQSGQPVIGTAQTGGFGSILGSSLELSNVDIATEFVTLIQTQQAFQANARVITSSNDLLTEAVNLVR